MDYLEYTIYGEQKSIDFGASGLQSILQNVRTIVTTIQSSVPQDRQFGIDVSSLDGPIEIIKARMTAKIIDAIREYEPRVDVTSVQYDDDEENGRLIPIVKIRIKEGESVA